MRSNYCSLYLHVCLLCDFLTACVRACLAHPPKLVCALSRCCGEGPPIRPADRSRLQQPVPVRGSG